MALNRRRFVAGVLAAGSLFSLPVRAQTAGKDFTPIIPAQPTEEPGKVEVLEFFSYGCPHCAEFAPLLSTWISRQSADVVVRKVPVTFGRAAWSNVARLYYALEATGDLARLEGDIFKAIHADRINLFDEKTMQDWLQKKGVDARKLSEVFTSFGIMSKVKRGDQLAQAYKIQGVPALAVEGRYLVGGKDFAETLAITDKLIVKSRSDKGGRK
jgi:thiol:disulfide interchange protein DsbA